MRIIVNGQQAFGRSVLEALLDRGEDVVGVFTAPDAEGAPPDPLKECAVERGLPVFQPKSFRRPKVWEQMRELKPDLGVMAYVTLFVPEEALNIPTLGHHPISPLAAAVAQGTEFYQLANHLRGNEDGIEHLLARQRPRHGPDPVAEGSRHRTGRHAGERLFQSPLPVGRGCHDRVGGPGARWQGTEGRPGPRRRDVRGLVPGGTGRNRLVEARWRRLQPDSRAAIRSPAPGPFAADTRCSSSMPGAVATAMAVPGRNPERRREQRGGGGGGRQHRGVTRPSEGQRQDPGRRVCRFCRPQVRRHAGLKRGARTSPNRLRFASANWSSHKAGMRTRTSAHLP